MAFAMALPKTKRVKFLDDRGHEEYVEDDRWKFLRAAEASMQVRRKLLSEGE